MNQFKSLYVSLFIVAALGGLVFSLVKLAEAGLISPWLGSALACAGPVLFFARMYAFPTPRTSRNMNLLLIVGAIGTTVAVARSASFPSTPVTIAVCVGILGSAAYIYWYSRFEQPAQPVLREGATLPAFKLVEKGQAVQSSSLVDKPALWIFYRGNWCPLCTAQVREIAGQYRELARRGVEVFLVSPQPERNSAALAAKFDAPMRFMTDVGNAAASTLNIIEKNGLPAGMQVLGYDSDVPRPTVFITAAGGKVVYCDLSDNYRVRPEPAAYFAVLDSQGIAAAA